MKRLILFALFVYLAGCGPAVKTKCKRVSESCAEVGHGICPHCQIEHFEQ